jgi:hypothetical protein
MEDMDGPCPLGPLDLESVPLRRVVCRVVAVEPTSLSPRLDAASSCHAAHVTLCRRVCRAAHVTPCRAGACVAQRPGLLRQGALLRRLRPGPPPQHSVCPSTLPPPNALPGPGLGRAGCDQGCSALLSTAPAECGLPWVQLARDSAKAVGPRQRQCSWPAIAPRQLARDSAKAAGPR